MIGYGEPVETKMVNLYRWLNKKDRRRYAAIPAEHKNRRQDVFIIAAGQLMLVAPIVGFQTRSA